MSSWILVGTGELAEIILIRNINEAITIPPFKK
jgi:hypothetical protein